LTFPLKEGQDYEQWLRKDSSTSQNILPLLEGKCPKDKGELLKYKYFKWKKCRRLSIRLIRVYYKCYFN
jgi:hypothetical protein